MSDNLRIIRIFIGSPGGLDEERQAAHEIVESVNRSHSERWGVLFRLLGWENAVPGYVRPQSKINEDLDRCDYFIGVLWNKWGSRPSTDPDGFTSGFEEEYFRAKARIENGLMRDMAIYFKAVEVPAGLEPGEEVKKVFVFRQKCIDEKQVFFKNFSDLQAFRDVIREKLEEIGWHETEILSENQQLSQPKNSPINQEVQDEPTAPDAGLLDEEARSFLTDLMSRPSDWDGTSPEEVARLRLIGTAVTRSGNDDFYLGNHDANLIFQKFREAPLSKQEIKALIDCGMVGFQHHNVPIWRWLAKEDDGAGQWRRVNTLAAFGSETEKKHAIEILGLLSQPIPSFDDFFEAKRVLSVWLSDAAPNAVFDAAVSFLSSNARDADVPDIEEIAASCSPPRRTKIEGAIVGILSRNNLDVALKRLIEKEVDKIDDEVAESLFKNPQSIMTETALSCLSAKTESIRLRAARVLWQRNEITLEAAQTLLTDNNHEIRLLAAESLKTLGVELDEDVAKKALRIVKPRAPWLGGLFTQQDTDESYYQRYVENRLKELDFATLKAKVEAAGVLDQQEIGVLYSKYPSKSLSEIRKNLGDCFKSHFESKMQADIDAGKTTPDLENRVRKLELPLRKQLCGSALSSLCGLAKAEDLRLVRKVLDEMEVDATENMLTYLARFGDWSDINRIKRLGDYPAARASLFEMVTTKLPAQKAAAIYALGKNRVADMLGLDLDSSIKVALAKLLPKKVFIDLRDEALLAELEHKNDTYRSVFALRCVQALPKPRASALLDRYVDGSEHRFYNSVHWLDLGASLPNALAKNVAGRALARY